MFQLFKKKESEEERIELPELEVDGDKIIISSPKIQRGSSKARLFPFP